MVTTPGAQFLARLYSEPLLISKLHLEGVLASLGMGAAAMGEGAQAKAVRLQRAPARVDLPFEPDPEPMAEECEYFDRLGSTAVISVCGPILKNPDWFDRDYLGACDVDEVRLAAELARMDDTIERVMLLVRSPGGTATGVPECGQALADLCLEKPLIGFTDTVAASAGYWFLSQAQMIYMTPSARVGSIGVYSLYQDLTKWLEMLGIKINAISVGDMKLAGAPFKPMTDEERAHFQAACDRIGVAFKEAVNSQRTLSEDVMRGQVLDAETAVEADLVDGIVWDFEEALELAREE
jgi:signal peptide peptidase SppA